ncbi:MafI family immunity protein [Citrobacter sedlakii]|nr:MafI family immunity protein [Citrobacter sedlakii]MBN6597855.1 MafI family immunity protein [Citrobacter sedlakii]QMK48280.1 MafI family immunity protein [Citrobacter sp. RHB21-C05]QMK66723.1 MafI family immunity protein [Citrobacter sp. RHB21-C01]HCJ6319541.1 MafI family immunity protein [Citrobacter sedlakii]
MATATGIKLKKFGEEFNNRLSEDELNYALSYIDFGEEPLAFETLCDYICEDDIVITKNEYEQICIFNSLFNYPLENNIFIYLKGLIK